MREQLTVACSRIRDGLFNLLETTEAHIDRFAEKLTWWLGTIPAILIHTFLFGFILCNSYFGQSISDRLLVLTTIVSIEAIYQSLFIQMTINKNSLKSAVRLYIEDREAFEAILNQITNNEHE